MSAVDSADVEILQALPKDKVWNVAITFPENVEQLSNNVNVSGSLTYSISRIQGWTDEPVDLNEVILAAANHEAKQYKLVAGDDESVPESVQSRMLTAARDIMFEVSENLLAG